MASNVAISTRGPRNVLVLDRNCVPVNQVCDELCREGNTAHICRKFNINSDEVFACAEAWVDVREAQPEDFIRLTIYENNAEYDVQTTGISDYVYLTLLATGRMMHPEVDSTSMLHAYGLESVITDCCFDITGGTDHYKMSAIHKIVFEEFENKYRQVDSITAKQILRWLKVDEDTINEFSK